MKFFTGLINKVTKSITSAFEYLSGLVEKLVENEAKKAIVIGGIVALLSHYLLHLFVPSGLAAFVLSTLHLASLIFILIVTVNWISNLPFIGRKLRPVPNN